MMSILIMTMASIEKIKVITFAMVRYLLPAQNGETPPETSM